MSQNEMWWLALGAFSLVTVVVAVLLGLIIQAAKRIDRHAAAIWTAGKQIAANTVTIWVMDRTNQQLERITDSIRSVAASAESIDESLRMLARSGRKE